MKLKKIIKDKTQFIRKKIADFERRSTYHTFFVNIIAVLVTLLLFEAVFLLATEVVIPKVANVEPSNSLYPIQVLEVRIVHFVHRALGYPIEIKNELDISYCSHQFRNGELSMSIQAPCAGIHEIVFISALITGFRGVPRKLKLKWIATLGAVLFIENLIRILVLYPIALRVGEDAMWYSHYIYWKYGHLAIILTLFVLWVLFVAKRQGEKQKYFKRYIRA
ncbi:MAG: exosortase/archaeosortase family protein [Candidatus Thermoplasmatota archaeon]|nr:exosortase/archaeosortase family protein [Candidatus Thermoplasmatota archaeon]